MDGSGNGNRIGGLSAENPPQKDAKGRFLPGNQARKAAQNNDQAIRAAVERAAKRGNMSAVAAYWAYYAGLSARDAGPALSDRVQALLADPDRRAFELALDDRHMREPDE